MKIFGKDLFASAAEEKKNDFRESDAKVIVNHAVTSCICSVLLAER